MKINIRLIYLYLYAFVGLLVTVIGCIQLVNLGIKVFVFKDADKYSYLSVPKIAPDGKAIPMTEEETHAEEERMKKQQEEDLVRQRQREIASALSMIIVGVPLYIYHWKTIQKEKSR